MSGTGTSPPPPLYRSPFRTDCLEGRVAVVTGGGSGIGFEIARQLALHGCRGVVLCGRRADFLQRAVDLLQREVDENRRQGQQQQRRSNASGASVFRAAYQTCDVRDPVQCERVMRFVAETFQGQLDILVNGAAGNFLAPASELKPKGFAIVMAIDAAGTFHMCRAAYPLLRASQHYPVIVNISATLQYGATWWQAHASAAKSAVDSLTRSLALEWGADDSSGAASARIRVVGIAPGPIANTPGTTKLAPSAVKGHGAADRKVQSWVRERIPLGRMGETWEIGLAAVYLCTALYVTGDVLVVDGGEWLYKPPLVPRHMVGALSRQVEAQSRAQGPQASDTPSYQQRSKM